MPKQDQQERIDAVGFSLDAQEKTSHHECNLCGTNSFILLSRIDRYGFRNNAYGCRRCGLVFLNPVMTKTAYRKFYRDTYRPLVSAFHGKEISQNTLHKEQEVYAADLTSLMQPYIKMYHHRNLLDIGGSIGLIADELCTQFTLNGTVLDPAPLELEQARIRGLETILGTLDELDSSEKFDIVLLCQTIDHCLDISKNLIQIRELLNDGGLFYVDIIDLKYISLREQSFREAIKPDHPYYLTELTIESYLKKIGFRVLVTEYAEHRVGYICEKCAPDSDFISDTDSVRRLFSEIRHI